MLWMELCLIHWNLYNKNYDLLFIPIVSLPCYNRGWPERWYQTGRLKSILRLRCLEIFSWFNDDKVLSMKSNIFYPNIREISYPNIREIFYSNIKSKFHSNAFITINITYCGRHSSQQIQLSNFSFIILNNLLPIIKFVLNYALETKV